AAAGIEDTDAVAVGEVLALVARVADQQRAPPAVGEPQAAFDAGHLQPVIDRLVLRRGAAFVLGGALGAEAEHAQFGVVVEAMAQMHDTGGIVVTALFAVFAQGVAVGVEVVHRQAVAGALVFAGGTGAQV